jgi:hypothetical protein
MPLPDAVSAFEALAPAVAQLRALQRHCKPFGTDYHAMAVAIAGISEAAEAVTGQPALYGAKCDTIGPIRPAS